MLVTRNDASGRAVRIQGDPTHPVTRGYLCNKVNHYLDLVYSEERVRYPHRRIGPKGPGAKFERISWDEAIDTVTGSFKRIVRDYGSEAIQPINFAGTMGQIGYQGMDLRFWNKLEAGRLEKSICVHAAAWANLVTYGQINGRDLTLAAEEAELIILWGFNPVSTSVHTVPFIRAAKARGCTIVALDPRQTRSTWLADWHLQPRPGTDAALALGMMKIIVDEGLHDQDFLERYTHGWRELIEQRLPDYPVDRVARITGLAVDDIERLARLYASTRKSHIRAGHGMNRHQNSGQMARSILLLPAITGAWRERCGGANYGRTEDSFGINVFPEFQRDDLGDRESKRLINMVQMARALSENIGEDGKQLDPPVMSLFVYSSDPANSVPNSNGMRRGLMRDDLFTVVHDTFWTDTCEYADIVLPADTQLERTDYVASYGNYHYAMNTPVIDPVGESVSNSELFRRLAQGMGFVENSDNAFTQTDEEIIRDVLFDPQRDPCLEGTSYEEFRANGWMKANVDAPRRDVLRHGWPTDNGKIQIYSEALKEFDQDPLPVYVPEMEGQEDPGRDRFPLQVLSNASHYSIGATFQSTARHRAMQSRPSVEISPAEAAARGIEDGDLCRLYNDRGETYVFAVVIDGLLDGMVVAQKQYRGSHTPSGVNVNALNTEVLTDFGFAPSFYSVLAEIEKTTEARAKAAWLEAMGGRAGYLRVWRARNPDSTLDDEAILAQATKDHPGLLD